MSSDVSFSFVAGEAVCPGTDLNIMVKRPFDRETARAAVVLQRDGVNVPTPTVVDEKSGTITVPTNGLEAGMYQLRIRELLDNSNDEIINHAVRPVRIDVFAAGKVPQEFRVEHGSRLAIGETNIRRLDSGEAPPRDFAYVEFIKVVHRENGEPSELAFNEKGDKVDGLKMLTDLQRRRRSKYGCLHETLHKCVVGSRDSDEFNVAIWPRIGQDLSGYEKPDDREITEPPSEAHDGLKQAIILRSSLVHQIKELGGEVKDTPAEAVAIYAHLTADQVGKMADYSNVGKIFLDDAAAVPDLVDSMAVARVPQAHALGYTGSGVHVAVFEDGPSDVSNLQFADRYQANPPASSHARLTSAIVKNVEPGKPNGYAPGCQLYSANSYSNDALRWALHPPQSCTVVSQSFHRLSAEGQDEQGSPFLSADDVMKDHLATQWPYPTIVHAAGNFSQVGEYVNHKGFNTLSVGSHDDDATAMAGSSVFKNPASSHGDRELPELSANGTGVGALGLSMSGTSFSAPAVAGAAALIQSVNPTLKSWPEGCRAILLASADRNITGGTWVEDLARKVDQSDGSGALDALMAVTVAQQRRVRNASVSMSTTPRGWDVGSLASSHFGTDRLANFRYRVHVPPPARPVRFIYTVKVALAWNAKITLDAAGVATSSILTVDLDLIVRDSSGEQVAVSASFDNSYEIVEFTGTAGTTYEIMIRRWSGTDLVWYGIAWNVTAKRLNVTPLMAERAKI